MPSKTEKTLLPFATYTETGSQPLKKDVEKAAIFCLAELNREKGKGIFKKQPSEKTIFVTRIHYPFWIAPLRNLTLLFDGLELSSHEITYPTIPDPEVFKESMNQSSATCEVYQNFLSNNLEYFGACDCERTEVVEGLISEEEFIGEFMNYLKEATIVDTPMVDSVIISSARDESRIKARIEELENSYSGIVKELKSLGEIIKLVNNKTQENLGTLREEIKKIKEKFGTPLEKARTEMEKKKQRITKDYNDRITEITNKYEKEILAHRKELIKLEKTKEDISSEINSIENKIKTAAINKDNGAEQLLKEKRNELKQGLPEVTTTIKNREEKILEIEEGKKKEFFQLSQEKDEKIKESGKQLREIEYARDAEVKIAQDEMEKIEEISSIIIGKVDQLAKMRESVAIEFDRLGVKQEKTVLTLAYMPFYLFCYQAESKKRYLCIAPSILRNGGFGSRLKMGKKRVSKFFQPRSAKIVSLLNGFLKLLEENIVFNHEISEACKKANILESQGDISLIKRGLSELEIEGWLSSSEYESFGKTLKQLDSSK